jgi:hypothetical protein
MSTVAMGAGLAQAVAVAGAAMTSAVTTAEMFELRSRKRRITEVSQLKDTISSGDPADAELPAMSKLINRRSAREREQIAPGQHLTQRGAGGVWTTEWCNTSGQ